MTLPPDAPRWRRILVRDIVVVLGLKAAAIALLFVLFFGPGDRLRPAGEGTYLHLIAPESAARATAPAAMPTE